jgi:hypothetical protein
MARYTATSPTAKLHHGHCTHQELVWSMQTTGTHASSKTQCPHTASTLCSTTLQPRHSYGGASHLRVFCILAFHTLRWSLMHCSACVFWKPVVRTWHIWAHSRCLRARSAKLP